MILNKTTNELTTISSVAIDETITISNNQLIYSSKKSRIFGDDFNLVWPKLTYGENVLSTVGTGTLKIAYRYPIKIGDCVIDINDNLHAPICDLAKREVANAQDIEKIFDDTYINVFGGMV